jgi:organic radical activating enzyme
VGERAEIYRPDPDNVLTTIWVQPMAEYFEPEDEPPAPDPFATKENMRACVNIAKLYGYRVSLQQHKILEVE